MQKFHVSWEKNGQKLSGPFSAENREAMEKYIAEQIPGSENIYVQSMAGHYDSRIRDHIQKLLFSDRVCNDPQYLGQVKERLRACADAAYMFGESSQESLERTLHRAVECEWEITGLDGHMFSFGFQAKAGYWGGIIFHCNGKDWSSHT